LVGPRGKYDVALNRYFAVWLAHSPANTQAAHARDQRTFLDFLWSARNAKGWRDASAEDRVTYEWWRRRDETGPRIQDSTWDREVATVNQFYLWAVSQGLMAGNAEKLVIKKILELFMLFAALPDSSRLDPALVEVSNRRAHAVDAQIAGPPGYSDREFHAIMTAARRDVVVIRDRIAAGERLLEWFRTGAVELGPGERERAGRLDAMARTGLVELDLQLAADGAVGGRRDDPGRSAVPDQ
jgi:hypothetical protein